MVCLLPLPLALEPKWSSFAYCSVSYICLAGLFLLDRGGVAVALQRGVFLPLFLLLGYTLLQILPLPIWLLGIVSPAKQEVLSINGQIGVLNYSAISQATGATLEKIILGGAYASTLYIGMITASSRATLLLTLNIIFITGVIYSALGFYLFINSVELFPRIYMDGHFNRLTGTFVSPNGYSSYLTYSLIIGIVVVIYRNKLRTQTSVVKYILDLIVNGKLLYYIGLLFILTTIILSYSRGTILSIIVGIPMAYIFTREYRNALWTKNTNLKIIIIGITSILVAYFLLIILSEDVIGGGERLLQWNMMLEMFKDYPVFGIGLGAFEWVFPAYRDGTLRSLHYSFGHSDVLQSMVELGFVGSIILGYLFYGVIRLLSIPISGKYGSLAKYLVIGVITLILIQLVHGTFDYIFHIPAITATLFYIIGMGLAPSNTILLGNNNASA